MIEISSRKFNAIGWIFAFIMSSVILSFFFGFDVASAISFVIIVLILIYIYKEKLDFQKVAFPFLYIILLRTNFGLKFVERFSKRFKGLIKLIGLWFIGFGFLAILIISILFFNLIFSFINNPVTTSKGVSLVVPYVNIPGIGVLSFWHFIISLFVIMIIHEFSHAIVSKAYDLKVKSSGIGILGVIIPIFPLAFVEPDEKKLVKKDDYIQYSVFSAGPMVNIILALIIVFAMPYVVNPSAYAPFEKGITYERGISFYSIQEGFPTEEAGVEAGMIITQIDNKKILNAQEFLDYMKTTRPGQEVTIKTQKKDYIITLTKNPDGKSDYGYLGIVGVVNEREVKEEYFAWKSTFYWFKGLFKWLFLLNLAVGMINFLPMFITDGSRMLQLALKRSIKKQRIAKGIFTAISSIFLLSILLMLIVNYGAMFFNFVV